jgi:hypothetical protein
MSQKRNTTTIRAKKIEDTKQAKQPRIKKATAQRELKSQGTYRQSNELKQQVGPSQPTIYYNIDDYNREFTNLIMKRFNRDKLTKLNIILTENIKFNIDRIEHSLHSIDTATKQTSGDSDKSIYSSFNVSVLKYIENFQLILESSLNTRRERIDNNVLTIILIGCKIILGRFTHQCKLILETKRSIFQCYMIDIIELTKICKSNIDNIDNIDNIALDIDIEIFYRIIQIYIIYIYYCCSLRQNYIMNTYINFYIDNNQIYHINDFPPEKLLISYIEKYNRIIDLIYTVHISTSKLTSPILTVLNSNKSEILTETLYNDGRYGSINNKQFFDSNTNYNGLDINTYIISLYEIISYLSKLYAYATLHGTPELSSILNNIKDFNPDLYDLTSINSINYSLQNILTTLNNFITQTVNGLHINNIFTYDTLDSLYDNIEILERSHKKLYRYSNEFVRLVYSISPINNSVFSTINTKISDDNLNKLIRYQDPNNVISDINEILNNIANN